MPHLSFADRLKQSTPILADGAMGTMLLQRGTDVSLRLCFDALNLSQPDVIKFIHLDYIHAGADLIETNTFGANRIRLSEHELDAQLREINHAGVRLAREAISLSGRDNVYVAGSVGPLGQRLKPYGRISKDEAAAAFEEQIRALIEVGVDALILETFADHEELLIAIAAARQVAPNIPVIAQATFTTENVTYNGHSAAQVANDLYRSGADVIGLNCGIGPAQIATVLQAMLRAVPRASFSVMPNAGFPEMVAGRVLYPATADYFSDYALTFKAMGARIIGGCCGTTPDHIRAMRRALDDPATALPEIQVLDHDHDEQSFPPLHETKLAQRLAEGKFTITVEMTPPRSYTAEKLLSEARLLRDAGADLIDVADTPAAKMKMSAWAVSYLLQTQIGMESILHFPTRGRNLLRIQGDLLAAHALGLRNLFVTMGDPTKIGDYPDAMDGYDIVPSKLIELIKQQMNAGRDMAGNSIGRPTGFTVGCALNMAAEDVDHEIKVLGNKLKAGSDFALGQAVFDPPRVEVFLKRYREINGEEFRLPVIMGVIPLYSLKHAQFLHNEVPGIVIPEAIFKRLEDAGEDAPQEGVRIAQELMMQLRDFVQGAYVIPSYGRYQIAAQVVDAIANLRYT